MNIARHALDTALRFALPSRCPGCGTIVEADHRLCADCWTRLDFPRKPACASCNLPFEFDRGEGARCGPCLADPPLHDGIYAGVAYGEVSRRILLKLKYAGRMAYAETAARLIERVLPCDIERIVPVPLHRSRLWSRGYNQAALIAEAIAAGRRVPIEREGLLRVRRTPVLRGLGPKDRARALSGAIRVNPKRAERLRGAAVLLVDDVYTSGATSDACIRVLKRAGAHTVAVAAFARVLPDVGVD